MLVKALIIRCKRLAVYATKAAECTGTLDRRITRAGKLDDLPVTPHARRLIAECLRIGQVTGLACLRTAEWAHMLGFRGHFSTKSRVYSTTLGALRAARAAHNRAQHADQIPSGDTVLIVADWHFAGLGHLDNLAAAIADIRQLKGAAVNARLLTVDEAAEQLVTPAALVECVASQAAAAIRSVLDEHPAGR